MAARADQLERVHSALDTFWGKLDQQLPTAVDTEFAMRFAAAVAEIAANIVEHAYPTGGPNHTLELLLSAYPDRVEALFTDRGIPFEESTLPRPGPNDQELPEGGYGLALARAAADGLAYQRTNDGVNEWRIVKKFKHEE
jgi:anti-sigma regulatory factor (Ser/Thr protein kinase)